MSNQVIPTAAQLTTVSAGFAFHDVNKAVVRVICTDTNASGTGFFHKSGRVITAEHVVRGSRIGNIFILDSIGRQISVVLCETDPVSDIAILKLNEEKSDFYLELANTNNISIGSQVSTWGYPVGYNGLSPLLTVGYLSGVENIGGVARWVVNAAFNGGNSGGPLLQIEDGKVIGLVASKLAPLPPQIESILSALSQQKSGIVYDAVNTDGSTVQFSEGQLIHQVLHFLRSQTQLVVGHAVLLINIQFFLRKHRIEP